MLSGQTSFALSAVGGSGLRHGCHQATDDNACDQCSTIKIIQAILKTFRWRCQTTVAPPAQVWPYHGMIFAYPRPPFSAAQHLQLLLVLHCDHTSAVSGESGIADLEHPASDCNH